MSAIFFALQHNRCDTLSTFKRRFQSAAGDPLSDFSNFVFSTDGHNNMLTDSKGANGSDTGAKTTYTYPSSGNNMYHPTSQVDPQGNETDYTYDSNGNPLTITYHKTGKTLTYTYNSNGTVATQTDFDGNKTTFGYDSKGNLSSVTPPSPLGKTTLTVDALSRESSVTDGDTQKTTYSYDNADRIKTITYADSSTVSYTYDKNGNVLTESDSTGTTQFQYDVLNRITKKTLPGGTVISMIYDKIGNLTSYNDGTGAVTYSYDQANRMTTLTEPDGAQTKYSYDNANRKTKIQYPNGTGMKIGYDGAGHETSNVGGTMDSNGNIQTTYDNFAYSYMNGSTQTDVLQSATVAVDPINQNTGIAWAYSYDSKNHLTQATKTHNSGMVRQYNYTYDDNGNRTQDVLEVSGQSTVTTNYTYGASSELLNKQIQGGATTTYSYDGNGNQTGSTGGPTFTYNAKDQAITLGSGTTQTERVKVNSTSYVYGTLGLTSQQTSSGTTAYVRCSCGLLNNERTPDGKKYYYLFDGLGSIVAMTDGSGNEVNAYDYDPYGNMVNSVEQSGLNNPWKFASGFLDSSTGLYKYGIRYYDPTIGRWTQRTPVGGSLQETTKANPYMYADDDPVNAVDPSGKESFSQWWGVLGGCLASSVIAPLFGPGAFISGPGGIAAFMQSPALRSVYQDGSQHVPGRY